MPKVRMKQQSNRRVHHSLMKVRKLVRFVLNLLSYWYVDEDTVLVFRTVRIEWSVFDSLSICAIDIIQLQQMHRAKKDVIVNVNFAISIPSSQ